MTRIHVIFHTHWDREWYFTEDDSQVLLNRDFKRLIKAMDNSYSMRTYLLDGQVSILEEYLQLNPQDFPKVKKLVSSGRLITGPWYTQTDLFNVSGESIIRNLIYGIRTSQCLGKSMMIGYVPDAFGQNAQMPTIFNAVGIKRAIGRRGFDAKCMGPSQFYWQGLDGYSRVLASIQTYGYSFADPREGARMENLNLAYFRNHVFPLLKKVTELAEVNDAMLPIGGDQVSFDPKQDRLIDELNRQSDKNMIFVGSSLNHYFDELEHSGQVTNHYKGELRLPRISRVHKTIGSARYDIKRLNSDAELALTRSAEVIEAICYRLGLDYDQPNLTRAWKMVLSSQAHDSMGTCNSDETNADIKNRLCKARHTANALFAQEAKIIAANVPQALGSPLVILNGSLGSSAAGSCHQIVTKHPYFKIISSDGRQIDYTILKQSKQTEAPVSELTATGEHYVKNNKMTDYLSFVELGPNALVSPLGYTTFYIQESDKKVGDSLDNQDATTIANSILSIRFKNGHLELIDLQNKVHYNNFFRLIDCADDGDLYDFSPLPGDHELINDTFILKSVKKAPNLQIMTLSFTFKIPARINQSRTQRVGTTELTGVLELSLSADSGLKIHLKINNQADSHRLRLEIFTDQSNTSAIADLPFGYINRIDDQSLCHHWRDYYTEYPVNIEPFEHSVVTNLHGGKLQIISKGLKEYQLVDGGIALTLFRSVGFLGKCDLAWRPGRSSGQEVPTPKSQLHGSLVFDLELQILDEGKELSEATNETERFLTPFSSYQSQQIRKDIQQLDTFDIHIPDCPIPSAVSLVDSTSLNGLSFSAVTIEKDGLLLRLANKSGHEIQIEPSKMNAELVNALDESLDQHAKVTVQPNSILNLRI